MMSDSMYGAPETRADLHQEELEKKSQQQQTNVKRSRFWSGLRAVAISGCAYFSRGKVPTTNSFPLMFKL